MGAPKTKQDFKYIHWVPAKKPREDFPFTYTVNTVLETTNQKEAEAHYNVFKDQPQDNKFFFELEYIAGSKVPLKDEIKRAAVAHMDFYKYMDPDKEDYIGKPNELKALIKLDIFVIKQEQTKTGKEKLVRQYNSTALISLTNFSTVFGYTLVESLEKLSEVLSGEGIPAIAFDTETTGLNPEDDEIVGVSLAMSETQGYYVPIAHSELYEEYNLGVPALDLIYEALKFAKRADFFNARFDMRMMEYTEGRNYDMLKVNVNDAQITCWFADPEYRKHDLKSLEKHFGGFYRPNLEDTLKGSNIETFNTALIHPKNITFYAAQDAISTFVVAKETYKYYLEYGISGQIDMAFLPRLMRMENHAIRVNIPYLESELAVIEPRLNELQEKLKSLIGDVNLSSPQQKAALFRSYGLDTGEVTDSGQMATGKDAVDAMIEGMEAAGTEIPEFLRYLGELSKLEKLKSTFFGALLEQAKLNNGRVRINYRNTVAATGRLSSGSEEEY